MLKIIHITPRILILSVFLFPQPSLVYINQFPAIFHNEIAFIECPRCDYTSPFPVELPNLKFNQIKRKPNKKIETVTNNPSSVPLRRASSKHFCFSSNTVFLVLRTDLLTGKNSVNLWLGFSALFKITSSMIRVFFNLLFTLGGGNFAGGATSCVSQIRLGFIPLSLSDLNSILWGVGGDLTLVSVIKAVSFRSAHKFHSNHR